MQGTECVKKEYGHSFSSCCNRFNEKKNEQILFDLKMIKLILRKVWNFEIGNVRKPVQTAL